jgi:hypothetical protein
MSSIEEKEVWVLATLVSFVAIQLAITIAFDLAVAATLRQLQPAHRKMAPGLVWLHLIPCFGSFWALYLVTTVTESLRAEFASRELEDTGGFAHGLGIAWAVCGLASFVPYLGIIPGVIGFVL